MTDTVEITIKGCNFHASNYFRAIKLVCNCLQMAPKTLYMLKYINALQTEWMCQSSLVILHPDAHMKQTPWNCKKNKYGRGGYTTAQPSIFTYIICEIPPHPPSVKDVVWK